VYKLTETNWIWRDGEFIRWADAQIHVLSHSVQFGSSVFEGVRCYSTSRGPAIFRLQDHLQRMLDSAKIYRMDLAYSIDDLVAACCELVERNELDSCYLRPMIVRGYGAAGMVPFASPVNVYLPCWPWVPTSARARSRTASTRVWRAGIASPRTRFPPWPRSPATISAAS